MPFVPERFRILYDCFFFFSSRRRHTRYWRDWSSDVCSSDLDERLPGLTPEQTQSALDVHEAEHELGLEAGLDVGVGQVRVQGLAARGRETHLRSEERRGGEGCRSRWLPDPLKKK